MPRRALLAHALIAVLLLALPPPAACAEGVPVGPLTGEPQSRPSVGADGRGGAVVSYKTNSLKVGAVRVAADGTPGGGLAIAPAALPFALEADEPTRTAVTADSQLVVVSDRALTASPAMTRLLPDGATRTGFPASLAMPLRYPALVPGRDGRTLLVATDTDATWFWTVRAAIIDREGRVEFALQLLSPLQFFDADRVDAASDGAGGLIAATAVYDMIGTGSKDIAVWRLAADGSRPWGDAPRRVIIAAQDQSDPHVVPDDAGGVIMAWTDGRAVTRSLDIFALRLDANGLRVPGWGVYGSPLCDAPGAQSRARLLADGTGGAWVVWRDQRSDLAGDLRYTHVLGSGALAAGFTTDGAVLCGAVGAQDDVALAGDGAGGCFAVWRDDRDGPSDIYAQHLTAGGGVATGWAVNGRVVSNAPGAQDQPAIAAVSAGRAVVAWRDARSGTTRIHAAGLVDDATVGVPPTSSGPLRLASLASSRHAIQLALSLPGTGPARLELLDVSGRPRAGLSLTGTAGEQTVTLLPTRPLEAGLYFARLRQGERQAVARATVLR